LKPFLHSTRVQYHLDYLVNYQGDNKHCFFNLEGENTERHGSIYMMMLILFWP